MKSNLNHQLTHSDLQKDLQSFGLNPTDWTILREKSSFYLVRSNDDQNFVFYGKAQRKGLSLKWKKLELVSL